ncbi:hypothetical protein [Bacillus timonensis]|uniref:hypothetical protein n=1 Tax=Bacillus timonensis TaxID=1033734 RepID=UPI000289B26A|nr:hypothetical protein [Bacillus timonensis]
MKRTIGLFLILQTILTYLTIDILYDPTPYQLEMTDLSTGITTTSYNHPLWFPVSHVILIISFILGVYLVLKIEIEKSILYLKRVLRFYKNK